MASNCTDGFIASNKVCMFADLLAKAAEHFDLSYGHVPLVFCH